MVVTKRAPVPPLPTSRTNSSQPVPRVKQKAQNYDPYHPNVSGPLANGKTTSAQTDRTPASNDDRTDVSPTRKGSKKSKSKRKGPKGAPSRLFDFLTQVFVVSFLVYVAVVCPEDVQHKTAVCRGLSEYKRLVVDPYILPPIHYALAHPSVAPYVEKAQPVAEQAVRIAKPLVLRARYEYAYRVVPQWNARVVPLWNAYATPQLTRLEAQLTPYRKQVEQTYQRRVGVHFDKAMVTMQQWQQKAQPYVILAAAKTHDGYEAARPYARPVYEKVQLFLLRMLAFLGDQRRQFVDPHVQKVWERVKELSSGSSKVPAPSDMGDYVTTRVSKAVKSAASVASSISASARASQSQGFSAGSNVVQPSGGATASDIASAPQILPSVVESVSPSSLAAEAREGAELLASGASSALGAGASSLASVASVPSSSLSSVAESIIPSASSVVSSYAASIPGVVQDAVSEDHSIASSVIDRLYTTASSIESAAPEHLSLATEAAKQGASVLSSGVPSAADQASSHLSSILSAPSSIVEAAPSYTSIVTEAVTSSATASVIEDADLASFYEDLGLGDILANPSSSEATQAPVYTETPEEKAAREAQKAERQRLREIQNVEKRADLESRHSRWEDDIAAAIQANRRALRKKLTALRGEAVADLKENQEIKEEIDLLVEEAEKLLRGAEKYLQTLEQESRREEEKKSLWDRVVDKVDEKFSQRLEQTEAIVNGWYLQVLNKELEEVRRITAEVKDLADRAQADLGMDYAYLDDVTYHDWQRYHDLLRTSDNFTAYANAIQDGTHASAVPNTVLPAIADLQSEVQDIVIGFATRLRRLKRTGERTLSQGFSEPGRPAADDIPSPDSSKVESPADIDVPPVVIGRSKQEVLDALDRAAAHDGQATSPTNGAQNAQAPGEVAHDLARDLANEDTTTVEIPKLSPAHEEL